MADVTYEHFAVGLVVDVKAGSKPVGWGDQHFGEPCPVNAQVRSVAASEPSAPFGSFEVGGWYWHPADIVS